MSNTFAGLSSLRAKDKKDTDPKPPSEEAKRLQNYLAAQYGAPVGDAKPAKKKKVKKPKQPIGVVRIVDTDVTGFAQPTDHHQRRHDNNDADEDEPLIANPEEAELLKRQAQQEREILTKGIISSWETVEELPPRGRASRQRHDSPEEDGRRKITTHDASPPRRRPRSDSPGGSGSDASPPRRRARHDSPEDNSDASPPRRRGRARHDSPEDDASPPRRRQQSPGSTGSDEDASLTRRRRSSTAAQRHDIDSDASPPRRPPPGGTRGGINGAEDGNKVKMSDGTAAGMVSGRAIQEEMARKREAEAKRFSKLGADVTGRGAETVYRDKSGQKLSKEEFVEARAAERQAGKAQYDDESQLAWGGGLKQRAEREEAERRLREEASKPFVRGHDESLDAEQKERIRWGDPMAHLVKKKAPGADLFDAVPSLLTSQQDALKKSGFVIPLEVPKHSWMRRGVGPPPNRYNIKPGRHWDGVDRSNGFERDYFKRTTELRRREQEAHMWAQGDM